MSHTTDAVLEAQAGLLVQKVRHYLITTMGRTADEADIDEFYRAFSYALREEVMINWLACHRTNERHNVRTLYYLSMEYLPGRLLANNLTNLGSTALIKRVVHMMNRQFVDVIAREPDPALGNGGLGRLASCFLDSLATRHYPTIGYGLRYQYGIFEQQLWNGVQIEKPDIWLINDNPWEFRRDLRKLVVRYCGTLSHHHNEHGEEIQDIHHCEEVWAVPYDVPIIGYCPEQNFSVSTLRLWTTHDSPRNFQLQRYNAGRLDQAAENTTLTDVLYPSDHHETGRRIRLKQEFLLVSASVQDIIRRYQHVHEDFSQFADKVRIQINDTHPALVIAELMRILTKIHHLPWNEAWAMTQEVCSYTNHTVLKEALEEWEAGLIQYLLPRQYRVIERLNQELCDQVRVRYPDDEGRVQRMSIIQEGTIRMAHLAIYGSHHVNGVAKLHTDILKKTIFRDFAEMAPEKFINITNGVTQRRWLLHCNPELSAFITDRIGDGWITNFSEIRHLADFADDPVSRDTLLAIKQKNKEKLRDYIVKNHHLRDLLGKPIETEWPVDLDALFDVQIKRVHEYKRQLLNVLHLIMLYHELLEHPTTGRVKRCVIFAGKAAAGYQMAKDIIRLIHCVARTIDSHPEISKTLSVCYLENYNVSLAERIIPAAELSQQLSTAGMEASGTGNMKLAMNGALTVGTRDGANIEMEASVTSRWWPFAFGAGPEEIDTMRHSGTYSPWERCAENPMIARVVDSLRDGTFSTDDAEQEMLTRIYDSLMEGHYGAPADRYFILHDLQSYYDIQQQVETLYRDRHQWAEYMMHNIAGMAPFSTDISIANYADRIWKLQPCPPDQQILEDVRHQYSEHDRCRIIR